MRQTNIKTNADALVGMPGLVIEVMNNASGIVEGLESAMGFGAVTRDDSRIEVGKQVTVREIQGCIVLVETITNKGDIHMEDEIHGTCPACGGTGGEQCSNCGGDGTVDTWYDGIITCDVCDGSGVVECHICGGDGRV